MRLAFLTTHPIQYQVPVFRELARMRGVDFRAYYCMIPDAVQQGEGFEAPFQWDLPLLEGYEHVALRNLSRLPSLTRYAGCDTPEIRERLEADSIDALVVNGWVVKSCLQGLRAATSLGIPCLVRGEANDCRPRPWWKRRVQQSLVKKYAACLFIGEANREFYLNRRVESHRLFASRYCVENDRFAESVAQRLQRRKEIRGRWRVAEEATCFLFSGKLIEKKHPVELIKAFRNAFPGGSDAHLLVVGSGELRDECRRIAGSASNITFAGFLNQTEIPDAYVAADCLVLPSDHGETWGLVVNEAMACGKPAIVSDQVGCAIDLVAEGETGWTFPFGEWKHLERRLVKAVSSKEKLAAMGQSARDRVSGYSPLAAAQGIVEAARSTTGIA